MADAQTIVTFCVGVMLGAALGAGVMGLLIYFDKRVVILPKQSNGSSTASGNEGEPT